MAKDLKALTRRWFDEVWNQGRLETIEEMLSPDVVAHGISEEPLCGVEGFKKFYQMYRAAFTEGEVTLHECISEGDMSRVLLYFPGQTHGEWPWLSGNGKRNRGLGHVHGAVAGRQDCRSVQWV